MDIKQILETSDERSASMYFNNSYILCGGDIGRVMAIIEGKLHVRLCKDNTVKITDGSECNFIDVPNFYYRINIDLENKSEQYAYAYRRASRSVSKGLTGDKLASNNRFWMFQDAMRALDKGEIIFSDLLTMNDFTWFKGQVVGKDGVVDELYEWLEDDYSC